MTLPPLRLPPFRAPLARWCFRLSTLLAMVTVTGVWMVLPDVELFPGRLEQQLGRNSIMGGFQIAVVLAALLMGRAAHRIRKVPAHLLNVPHPDFCLLPHREACARRRLEDDVWWLGTWTMWVLAWSACSVWSARTRFVDGTDNPPEEWRIVVVMSVALAVGALVRRGFYGRFKRTVLSRIRSD